MPSTETITSFYTFVAANRAKSAEVNANFNLFRGHLIPIDPNTATAAATKTYNLGSSDHRWGASYFVNLNISATLTTTMLISGLSTGAWSFGISGTSFFKVVDEGYVGVNATPMTYQNPTATVGNFAARSTQNTTLTASGHIANSTCTLQTIGRPVMISLATNGYDSFSHFIPQDNTTGADEVKGFSAHIVLDGVIGPAISAKYRNTSAVAVLYPASAFYMVDFPAAGYHTYSLYLTLTAGSYLKPQNIRLNARSF